MALPMRLDAVIDDVSTGAVIRHQTGDYNAVIIEFIPIDGDGKFLAVKLDWDGEGELKKRHYKKFLIEDLTEWMVLDVGTDFALGEGE